MSKYSTVDEAVQLGAVLRSCVDMETGELIAAESSRGGSRVSGGVPPRLEAAGGLSNPHICTRGGSAEIWVGGSLMKCHKPTGQAEQVGGGKRGKVTGFSSASRRRMLYLVGKIERAKLPVMITLTYPADFPTDGKIWKKHLRNWWQRLARKVPGVGGIWKLEPQKRGAPHFHLVVWGLERIPLHELRSWVSRSWYQVVASGDERHLQAGTRVEQVVSRRGVLAYATKYLGKINEAGAEGWDEPGRFWGVKSADNIPWASLVLCALTMRQAIKLLRLMRRAMHCRRGNLPGLTMLSNNPDYWYERLDHLVA